MSRSNAALDKGQRSGRPRNLLRRLPRHRPQDHVVVHDAEFVDDVDALDGLYFVLPRTPYAPFLACASHLRCIDIGRRSTAVLCAKAGYERPRGGAAKCTLSNDGVGALDQGTVAVVAIGIVAVAVSVLAGVAVIRNERKPPKR
jgi:hypothetical protein